MRRLRRLGRPFRSIRRAFARRLSWKLALSHLIVVLLTIVILVTGSIVIVFLFASPNLRSLPQPDPDMQQGTRIYAALLADDVAAKSPAQLTALLSGLPPPEDVGSGTFGGSLSPGSALVLAAPDGTILASSRPDEFPAGQPLDALEPGAWAPLLRNALRGERSFDPGVLQGRDDGMRVLVTAYPITDGQGRVVGALGLRSAPMERNPSAGVILLTSLSLSVLTVLAAAAIPTGIVSSVAGFLVARGFGRRLRALEEATEVIARGDLARRVTVASPDEIGRLGERFNLLAERLEAVDRARRAFVSNISHELRTPLAIIRGHVEAQLAAQPSGCAAAPVATREATREALEVVDRESRTLAGLIDDLFTVTRLEEAALPLRPGPVPLKEVADAAVDGIRPLALAQGRVSVSSLVPADLPPVLADRARLGQILGNLLYNALRHTPAGGVIVVEATPLPDVGAGAIEVGVTDTGAGITPDELPHIFDRFYRSEESRRREGSSGLGLAIVKQLVEAQGGAVRAESTPGAGTSIRFTLPRAGK